MEIDGILYISGQIGLDAVTGEMAQGVEEQTMLALTNMQHIMEVAGIGFSNVVKATVFLADINDFDTVNQVYEKFFLEHFPARAAVQVTYQISLEVINVYITRLRIFQKVLWWKLRLSPS